MLFSQNVLQMRWLLDCAAWKRATLSGIFCFPGLEEDGGSGMVEVEGGQET